jgi:hypothetical protein
MKTLAAFLTLCCLALPLCAQHEHHAMHNVSPAKLALATDTGTHVITARLGPLNLPAHTGHMAMPQPAPQILEIPFDGWITAYHPSLVDGSGAPLPGRMLHHVAFWNTARADFLCPNKDEHIFGAGGEMNDWPALPGFGYRVRKGDRIRVTTMFHNPTETSYSSAWLVVRMEYQPDGGAPLKSVYPAWFDVKKCGDSSFPLAPDGTTLKADIAVNFSGRLLGVGGHLHDYGQQLELADSTQHQAIATLKAELDDQGHIRSIPVTVFLDRGGFPLKKGDTVNVQARYDKPRAPNADGMAIVVGYFLPENDTEMQSLARR